MRGYIQKLGKNKFRICVSLGKNSKGKYEYYKKVINGPPKAADTALREALGRQDKGLLTITSKKTLGQYLIDWLNLHKSNTSIQTADKYEYVINKYINPVIGNIGVGDLKPQYLMTLYSGLLKENRIRTARYCYQTIHKALADAVKMGIVGYNVCDSVDSPKTKRREMKILNESDIHLFLEMSRSTPYFSLFYTSLFTGLRRSELLALRWSDVDLDPLHSQVSVNRTIHQLLNKDGKKKINKHTKITQIMYSEPKTQKSRRAIPLTPSNAVILREHLEAENKKRTALNLKKLKEDDLVFCNIDNSPYLPDNITKAWHKLCHKCGIDGVRLHDARHSHASLMLKLGVNMKVIQERLGHSSVAVTMDIYSHLMPGMQNDAAAKFDNIIQNKTPEPEKAGV